MQQFSPGYMGSWGNSVTKNAVKKNNCSTSDETPHSIPSNKSPQFMYKACCLGLGSFKCKVTRELCEQSFKKKKKKHQWIHKETSDKNAGGTPETMPKVLRFHLVELRSNKKCQTLNISLADLIKKDSKILFDTINSRCPLWLLQSLCPPKQTVMTMTTLFL